ncbi:hypothetical protein LOAG_08450 [Loa loa]|uniref:G-protein coupled receptors family 1 profile domain-containing protein n=1 Tax=Loa loa TaxID=7209 RepID=A0A1S0TTL3_LOALO|nr:hypothetical protein LOAG_08450 [Loa loa]EFO20043.1 hypothetical protein LOAG_08450 [Loa loa]
MSMDLTGITEVATKAVNNITVLKGGVALSPINYILRTYAYLAIGTVLTLINIPVFLLVITNKALRDSYLILGVISFNNGFTGIGAILLGMKRLIDTSVGEWDINHHYCAMNVPILLITAYFLNGMSLFMNSVERFSVIAFPIYYFTHNTRISYSLIIIQYLTTIIVITITAVATYIEPARTISNFCLKFGAQFLSSHSPNRDLSNFLKKQKRYTQTALISCCFTIFLVVIPSIVQYIYILDETTKSRTIVIVSVYLPFLNSLNVIMFFVFRQGDFRRAAIHSIKGLFHGQEHQIQPVTGFR